jgi:hypothetical protein
LHLAALTDFINHSSRGAEAATQCLEQQEGIFAEKKRFEFGNTSKDNMAIAVRRPPLLLNELFSLSDRPCLPLPAPAEQT